MPKSYKCEQLETTLHFQPDKINFCCSNKYGLGINIKKNENIDKNELINTKKKYIKMLNKGIIPKECEGCTKLQKKSFKDFFKYSKLLINYIIIDHFKECDCDCIYCTQKIIYKGIKQKYQLLPFIKELYKQNIIDKKNLKVEFQGGNVSMLNEFDQLINEFQQNNCKIFFILMNGIKYLPILEKIKPNKDNTIAISLDCGTENTFKKIKKIDAFNETIENIKKLKNNTSLLISLKYIIINGINDNLDEVKSFLDIANNLKAAYIIFEIDFRDTMMNYKNEFKIPAHYYEIIEYVKNYCSKNSIKLFIPEYTNSVLKKGSNIL